MTDSSRPAITRFAGTYRFLSNFATAPVTFEGEAYPTVEHAFQAAKALPEQTGVFWDAAQHQPVTRRWRDRIRMAGDPGSAKSLGRQVPLREDWDDIKLTVMKTLLLEKFRPGTHHLTRLLDTYPAELVEGNTWRDTFWGVYQGRGENHLGRLLMEVREQRRQEQDARHSSPSAQQ